MTASRCTTWSATTKSTTKPTRENNRDGANDNHSCNWGVEGPTDDPGINVTREKIKRAMLMTLMFSNGTPMLLGGDEIGRTQGGNNNAYCQDNEMAWFDWSALESDAGQALTDFTRRCIAARAGQCRRCT